MSSSAPSGPYAPGSDRTRVLLVAALGVVYGDIGTSPLYAIRECFTHEGGVLAVTEANILGVLSTIVWSQVLLITLKYVIFIMRADNQGQGGILALMALAIHGQHQRRRTGAIITALAAFGTALFFGDGMLTPAISVLSAVEGLEFAAPWLHPAIVPLTIVIIVVLFAVQSRGTESVGRLFGPIMGFWFLVLAMLGLWQIAGNPAVLQALSPHFALRFIVHSPMIAFITLGAVFLAVTGAEALYADMGHFGARPIRIAWLGFVFPALTLNYLGQGALLLADPAAVRNPFYMMVPGWLLVPLIVLATMATVIASQAVISGAFSLARQCVQLGFLPRLEIRHTSEHEIGQIYVPRVNWLLMIGVIILVTGFKSSSALASAYGIAVTGTMLIDSLLFWFVARRVWGWSPVATTALVAGFVVVDAAFLGSNMLKIVDGGWFPLIVGTVIVMVMATWRDGRRILATQLHEATLPVDAFIGRLNGHGPQRVAGTAVYLTGNRDGVPYALLHNLKHNKILHERIVFLTVRFLDSPFVGSSKRYAVEDLGKGFYRIVLSYGFKQSPNVPRALARIENAGGPFEVMQTSFFLGRERLVPKMKPLMARWRQRIFIAMQHNQLSATEFFRIPSNRVVELGTQVEV
ncbi:MAG: potassium transporter Kup [Alphaproteobacteria bacterium]|nr:potassium transporter Kup [Alphaproteobacteria bacterium]